MDDNFDFDTLPFVVSLSNHERERVSPFNDRTKKHAQKKGCN